MMDEIEPEENQQDQPVEDATPLEVETVEEDGVEPPYFVSISRRSGFRRLHKNHCCGVMPWQCYKVEWIHEVKEGTHCKHCLKACGKLGDEAVSSSSGSSSSTEDQTEGVEQEEEWERIERDTLDFVPIR